MRHSPLPSEEQDVYESAPSTCLRRKEMEHTRKLPGNAQSLIQLSFQA